MPEPAVFPVAGGGIGVQWQAGNRELQFSIYPDGAANYLIAIEGDEGSVQDGNLVGNYEAEASRLIRWLVEG